MTWASDVESQRSADKEELYLFNGPQIVYAYTSNDASRTYDGNTYAPRAGLRRSARGASSSADQKTLIVTMRGDCDLATDYAYGVPLRSLRLRVYEFQRTSAAAVLVWDGDVTDVTPDGDEIEIRSASILGEKMSTPIPGVVFQKRCAHVLGDARCRVDMEDPANKLTAQVASVSPDGFTVTVDDIAAFPDDDFKAGTITRDTDSEQRTISHQVGPVLTLTAPFRTIAAADAVTLYVGCRKEVGYCQSRFDNVVNFGGHPGMPKSNPFTRGLVLSND